MIFLFSCFDSFQELWFFRINLLLNWSSTGCNDGSLLRRGPLHRLGGIFASPPGASLPPPSPILVTPGLLLALLPPHNSFWCAVVLLALKYISTQVPPPWMRGSAMMDLLELAGTVCVRHWTALDSPHRDRLCSPSAASTWAWTPGTGTKHVWWLLRTQIPKLRKSFCFSSTFLCSPPPFLKGSA